MPKRFDRTRIRKRQRDKREDSGCTYPLGNLAEWCLGIAYLPVSFIYSSTAFAQSTPASSSTFPLSTLVTLSLLAFVPFVFLATTSFVKLSFVFSILRNAIGTGQVPSSMIITALAALLTFYVMTPVGKQMWKESAKTLGDIDFQNPMKKNSLDALIKSIGAGKEPLQKFLKRNADKEELNLFFHLATRKADQDASEPPSKDDFIIILSAFFLTELKEAFQIGFLVYIPFLIIDIVVANILLALGMQMLSPISISLPFKLLLFVLVDGFYILTQALILGYQ